MSQLYPPFCNRTAIITLLALLTLSTSVFASERVIKHAFGITHISGKPERVVSLYQGATDTAVALGIPPVGAVESWLEKPMYSYLREALEHTDYLGLETQPDLESIAWLKPDLIVGARYRHEQIYPLLSRIAPTVVPDTAFDFKAMLKLIGEAAGRQQQADQLLNQWDKRVESTRNRLSRQLGKGWPQQAAVISFRADHARIYYDSFARRILDEIGFDRPNSQKKDGWGIKLTSLESIPAMDADVIFIFMRQQDPAVQRTFQRWQQHPLWQNLNAVKNNQVYLVDPITWNMGGGILAANRMLDDLNALYSPQDTPGSH
ncbi:ABC transporter substrate-binding protein [Marinobacterium mangrovicola]|uniref:Iron complex transport system substrate-binding protein n=1 Tax=Marinobacterium mangrovicola TaxID=1476959 RepID=A0A4R1GIY7_9GAMM|nr:iron-siderophore ABC transporter substrate-binding protein [Marinobacterium mangrovicola]TCK07151.1 iron complex transport system substrate-binding protein [Marinobacterium mangrovicola]